jgi:hypothetical protein
LQGVLDLVLFEAKSKLNVLDVIFRIAAGSLTSVLSNFIVFCDHSLHVSAVFDSVARDPILKFSKSFARSKPTDQFV